MMMIAMADICFPCARYGAKYSASFISLIPLSELMGHSGYGTCSRSHPWWQSCNLNADLSDSRA